MSDAADITRIGRLGKSWLMRDLPQVFNKYSALRGVLHQLIEHRISMLDVESRKRVISAFGGVKIQSGTIIAEDIYIDTKKRIELVMDETIAQDMLDAPMPPHVATALCMLAARAEISAPLPHVPMVVHAHMRIMDTHMIRGAFENMAAGDKIDLTDRRFSRESVFLLLQDLRLQLHDASVDPRPHAGWDTHDMVHGCTWPGNIAPFLTKITANNLHAIARRKAHNQNLQAS